MARSKKPTKGKSPIDDANLVEESAIKAEEILTSETEKDEQLDSTSNDEAERDQADTSESEVAAEETAPIEETSDDSSDIAETSEPAEEASETPPPDPAETAPLAETGPLVEEQPDQRRAAVLPMILGGVVAAAIGFGAAQFVPLTGEGEDLTADLRAALTDQQSEIAALRAELDALAERESSDPDTETSAIDALTSQFSDLQNRLSELELRPVSENTGAELSEALQNQITALQARIEELATSGAEQVDTAKQTLLRAAITQVESAVHSGEAFAEALRQIAENSETAPDGTLTDLAETGVATEAELRQSFPAAARAAIAAETQANIDSGEISRVSGFLQQQLGMRSLTPRDGDSADAVLSRAQAALDAGDLGTSLTELSALSDAAAPAMADWIAAAQARQAALDGITGLAADLNSN